MKASIDIKITYDDLSEQCKQKIKKLEKELDCTVNLVYPDIASTPSISFGKTYPYISHGSGSSDDGFINIHQRDRHDWRDDIARDDVYNVLCSSKAAAMPEKAVYGKIKHPDGSTSSTSIIGKQHAD